MSRVRVIEIMRRGPRGAPGDMDPAEWDALQDEIDAKLPIADVLNEPDMATGATDKPPSQASVKTYVDGKLIDEDDFASNSDEHAPTQQSTKAYVDAGLSTKLDDTVSPALLLSPDGSRNRRGAVTPTVNGTVGTTAGAYGTAWDFSGGGYLSFPTAGHINPAQGTVMIRLKRTSLASNTIVYDATTGTNYHRAFLSTTFVPFTRFGAAVESRSSGIPAMDADAFHVLAVRWSASGHRAYLDGVPGTQHTDTPAGTINATARIGQSTAGTSPFPGLVEALVIYSEALTDAQITALSTMQEAWTWTTARVPSPEAVGLAAHLADTGNPHEVTKAQVGLGNVDNTADLDKPISTATRAELHRQATSLDRHTRDWANPHRVTRHQLGLGNVDNTRDADKPISTAAQAIFDSLTALLKPDAVRYEGDVLWVGPAGPQWHNWEDIQNDVWENVRFNFGTWGTGEMPGAGDGE